MATGCLIAAPHSGSGKTTITLGLLAALKRSGIGVRPAKAGPDFIDPAFHKAACGVESVNLDPWAMGSSQLRSLIADCDDRFLLVEGMMGLFDGASDGTGSGADLAELLGLPVVLVVDAGRQSHSIAALVSGFRDFQPNLSFAGVILNRVGSERHEAMLRQALEAIDVPVLGAVRKDALLELPSRHLGLVQAQEHEALTAFIDHAAQAIKSQIDLSAIASLERKAVGGRYLDAGALSPPGQVIAVASDRAFAFAYPHIMNGWREAGSDLHFFSPLADEAPLEGCDAIYLPGGYPELHAGQLAGAKNFMDGLRRAAEHQAFIYGECGGYMVLGEALVDGDGCRHKMANLLPLLTSFEKPRLQLGYRVIKPNGRFEMLEGEGELTAHEFHYSTVLHQGDAEPLFFAQDAMGKELGPVGLRRGTVCGSYLHLISSRPQA